MHLKFHLGVAAGRFLTIEGKEEGKAQVKVVLGGVRVGVGCLVAGRGVLRCVVEFGVRCGV